MKINYPLPLIYFFCSISVLTAQDSKEILCRILDKETKYPVSYATVKYENTQRGVVADEEGDFRLPEEFNTSNNAIIISSIGFETLKVESSSLKPGIINIIYLKPKVEALSAVMITATKSKVKDEYPKEIVREAIKRIPDNYPQTHHSYIGYYRDYQLVNNKYYNLNESILENFDAGFQTNKFSYSENVTALYSYDLNKNFYMDSVLLKSVYGASKIVNKDESARFITALENELEILNGHNPIRNYNRPTFSFVNTFNLNFIDNHIFKLQQIKFMDGVPLYEISFVSRDTENAKFSAEGSIFIAKYNFAIYKIEYRMLQNDTFGHSQVQSSSQRRASSGSMIIPARLNTLYEISVEYKAIKEIMYLNYMTFNNRFIIKEPNPFKVEDFEFDPNDEAFYITFNKSIDQSSIERKSRFKLSYKDKKLIVKNIELKETNVIKVEVVDWAAGIKTDIKNVKSEDFSYKLKRIKDVAGNTLDKESKLLGFQFREFFTQEVFENKRPSSDLIYVNKMRPVSFTNVNKANFDISKYRINSPLKKTKGN